MVPDAWLALRNMRRGDTCIVAGNGPSLKETPLSDVPFDTFGTNRCFLPGGFTPTFYVSVNPLVIEQSIPGILSIDASAKFIAQAFANQVPGSFSLRSNSLARFSMEPWNGLYEGFTVTFVCLQLAYFLGYRTVLLVGVDHRYDFNGVPNEQVVSTGADPNHFNSDYFGSGFTWNNPDLARSETSYRMALSVFDGDGRRIVNCTPGSALDVFERGKLEDWL
ncbi:MAG: hypothetical protein LC130_16920 [Bryobacterales bacterium]|nr:hypothetical protein [Bryobacterales bacterium]